MNLIHALKEDFMESFRIIPVAKLAMNKLWPLAMSLKTYQLETGK